MSPDPRTETAREIVRRSGSNLAFALHVLPASQRRDMEIFYAFCRVVDDIADEEQAPAAIRSQRLQGWLELLRGERPPASPLEGDVLSLCERYPIRRQDMEDIIRGVGRDIAPEFFATREDLKQYCYQVASAVGLVSIEIFGYQDPSTRLYAEQLGYALQWTNILRDVGEDARAGRVYLPEESLDAHGLTAEALLSGEVESTVLGDLLREEAAVARDFYRRAVELLPPVDRRSMRSAEMMRRVYSGILDRMEKDGFQVWEKRYRLPKVVMLLEWARAKWFA